jgi:hypothetical protein
MRRANQVKDKRRQSARCRKAIKYIPESGLGTDYAMKPLTAHKILIASAVVFSSSFRFGNTETAQTAMAGLCDVAPCILSWRYGSR